MQMIADAVVDDPVHYQRVYGLICRYRPDSYINLGNYLRDRGDDAGAAAGFIAAADLITTNYLPQVWQMPWRDMLVENIEYLEWAGMAHVRLQKAAEASALFKRALSMVGEYQSILGAKTVAEFQQRIESRL